VTFYYDSDEDELVGNNMFYEDYDLAERDGDTLRINVEWIMDEGRGEAKLREIRDSVQAALDAHSDDGGE
jgi:hypothetical protein